MDFWVKTVLEDMNKQLERIVTSLNRMEEQQIWQRPRASMNSIGNLCLHLAGNEYQNLVSAVGGLPFIRERIREFTTEGGVDREQLVELLRNVRTESGRVLRTLTAEDMQRQVYVRFGAEDWKRMNRSEEAEEPGYYKEIGTLLITVGTHYGYHAGQIVQLARQLQEGDEHITGMHH